LDEIPIITMGSGDKMTDQNVNVGDKIVTSIITAGTEDVELEVVQTDITEGGFHFLLAKDNEGSVREIPYGWFEVVEEKPQPNVIKADEWVVGKTFIVPKDRELGLQAPFYPIIKVLEEGVVIVDDLGNTQTKLFRNVEQVDPYDTFNRLLDLASDYAKFKNEIREKLNKVGNALIS